MRYPDPNTKVLDTVNLDRIEDLGVWVWVPHGGAVVGDDEWHAAWSGTGLHNTSKLELCFLRANLEWHVSALCVVEETKVLVRLWDADHVHEACWEGEVCSGTAV